MTEAFIPLVNGGCAVVDEADIGLVISRTWYGVQSRGTRYAKTGKNDRMHRIIVGVTDSSMIVDHINGDGLDNRRSNLRVVTVSENVANRQRSRAGNKCPGVWIEGGQWVARVTACYKRHRLGRFDREEDAIAAVNMFRVSIGRPPVRLPHFYHQHDNNMPQDPDKIEKMAEELGCNDNRVTRGSIQDRIREVEFATVVVCGQKLMYCGIKMDNGFVVVVGKPATCMDPANWRDEIGRTVSYDNSFSEIWRLEAYRRMS